ncbi:hypothetical protein CHLNCDRAFT_33851 [Chlorella variabilis]|uniref:CobW/HypB/UreG nucleotide-binding domain-containing protein n=1 Tax=Chlorella variabilis TaxID=554065 RepID=E1Z4S3_CHLVA|nr:hypothetical protein CHLNCDRAFT_33851 [Chlorella variabilis]EFN59399.1 hypothetical protein CHLNCDRAFT_33851 [Chlorella variabilis]|eukprot:XP_005851501.1 hypothetical protein CHLNCDRAFT_33851 [Chlorella variabilis]
MKARTRVLILGAAGRDFHNFNVLFRDNDDVECVGFTAAQIPNIEGRLYPPELSGKLYPEGLHIWAEEELEQVIRDQRVDKCLLSYSDLPHSKVMLLAGRCLAVGADFELAAPEKTYLRSCRPVVATCAVRTGCGKSQVSRYIIDELQKRGKKCVLVRHPMPYGNLAEQAVQRFESYEDLATHKVTIEEREEYEQHIKAGTVVYAGVDYEAILRQAEKEADVVIWDGGNNDTPFYRPDLFICITDPHRVGHEQRFYPGDVCFRMADAIVINKANTAPAGAVEKLKEAAAKINPGAAVYVTDSDIVVDAPELVKGKRVVLIEDGPTLTHGGMAYGAGKFAAEKFGAGELVDPRPYLVGSMLLTYRKNLHLGKLIPAMGYYPEQIADLEASINAVPCDTVIIATPMDLRKIINIEKPATVVSYAVQDRDPPFLREEVDKMVKRCF